MNRLSIVSLGVILLAVSFQLGCQPQQPVYLGETNYKGFMKTRALKIDYPDADVSSSMEVCNSLAPLTLDNPNPTDFWDLTLEEAIQMALKNSKAIRTLNGVSFSQGGVGGVPGTLLASPTSVSTIYDPALAESDPRYGVEAALSQFDATLQAGANWVKSDVDPIAGSVRSRYSGNSFTGLDDYGEFTVGINKYAATGGQFYMNHGSLYSDYGLGTSMRSSWATYLEGGFTQPLLQGNGIQFNRIAGVGATPGFYNGVAIARLSADTTLNDFEMAARNLVADVEKAYWNLYYAYHYLESVKSGRDSSHQTWQQTYAKFVAGAVGGSAQYEAQARNNYYTFRAQTEVAQSNLFKTESVLRYIIGLTSTDGRLVRPVDDPIIAPLQLDWDNAMCESLLRSPELRKQKWDVKRRELELIASKNFLLPRLDLNAGYQWNGAGRDLIQSHRRDNAFANMTGGDYASWVIGLNASMPLGWRKELAGVRNAQLNLAKSRALLNDQELELSHQLADSFREISQTYQQSRTMLNRRIAADDEVRAVNAAYQVGTTTLDQLLDAQKRQAEAETAYYRSIVDYNLAIMTLHYRKGSLLEYNNVALAEGPWPAKAYFDAKRRARAESASKRLNYGFTRPKVVSRGTYRQFQNHNSTMEAMPTELYEAPVMPQGEPQIAPPAPTLMPTTLETTLNGATGIDDAQPTIMSATHQVPLASNVGNTATLGNTQVSFTTPSVLKSGLTPVANPATNPIPTRNNRYTEGNTPIPAL